MSRYSRTVFDNHIFKTDDAKATHTALVYDVARGCPLKALLASLGEEATDRMGEREVVAATREQKVRRVNNYRYLP